MSHVDNVKVGINALIKARSELDEKKNDIENLIDEIPLNFGKRDELGNNTEDYLKMIKDDISKNMIDKIDDVIERERDFRREAARKDAAENKTNKPEVQTSDTVPTMVGGGFRPLSTHSVSLLK